MQHSSVRTNNTTHNYTICEMLLQKTINRFTDLSVNIKMMIRSFGFNIKCNTVPFEVVNELNPIKISSCAVEFHPKQARRRQKSHLRNTLPPENTFFVQQNHLRFVCTIRGVKEDSGNAFVGWMLSTFFYKLHHVFFFPTYLETSICDSNARYMRGTSKG